MEGCFAKGTDAIREGKVGKMMTEKEKQQKREEMHSLVDTLNQTAKAYYQGMPELVSNFEWDKMFDQLLELENQLGEVFENSPTKMVSEEPLEGGQKEAHEYPALSLAKTKDTALFVKWTEGRPVWVSVKLDGCTLVATYEDGHLVKLMTRGNGEVGTNITHLAAGFLNLPLDLNTESRSVSGHMVIRGEAVMSYKTFLEVNATMEDPYENPRNLVAGSLTLKSVEELAKRRISWIPFTLVYTEQDLPLWGDRMSYLQSLGFETVWAERCERHADEVGYSMLERVMQDMSKKIEDGLYAYPADGLVEVFEDTLYAATGTVTRHHANRAGFAFKWQDETAETTLDHIEWSCAAQCITPVAVFDPVRLEGTTVKRASLANISECKRLGIGGPGSRISVIKANKIIPKVVYVEKAKGQFLIPDRCPVCGAKTVVRTSASGAETLHCVNPDCGAKKLSVYVRFVSKDGMNIEGLSVQTIQQLVSLGWIKEFADFYKFSDHFEELKTLSGFGERSVEQLRQSLEKSRFVTSAHFLYGLSIPMVGYDVCRRLLSQMCLSALLEQVMRAVSDGDLLKFEYIDGIGPEKSKALVQWFGSSSHFGEVMNLLSCVHVVDKDDVPDVKEKTGHPLSGKVFVVTGSLEQFANRKALKDYIEEHGGKVAGSVTKKTDYLINNDSQSVSSKNKKAKELGVPVMTEAEFVEQFGK